MPAATKLINIFINSNKNIQFPDRNNKTEIVFCCVDRDDFFHNPLPLKSLARNMFALFIGLAIMNLLYQFNFILQQEEN